MSSPTTPPATTATPSPALARAASARPSAASTPAAGAGRGGASLTLALLLALALVCAMAMGAARQAPLAAATAAAQADAQWLVRWLEATPAEPRARGQALMALMLQHGWRRLRLLDSEARLLWVSDGRHAVGPWAQAELPYDSAGASVPDAMGMDNALEADAPSGLAVAWLASGVATPNAAGDTSQALPGSTADGSPMRVELELVAGRPASAWPATRAEWLAAAGLLLALAALVDVAQRQRALRRDLRMLRQQADALLGGARQRIDAPAQPDLRPLAETLNRALGQLQAIYAASTQQVEALRLRAHVDTLTGVANRRHFFNRLEQVLQADSAVPRLGLLLLRVHDLVSVDRRIGRPAADHLLEAVAQTLQTYTHSAPGCLAGRLNGADFALLLPVPDLAEDTARALSRNLRMAMAIIDPGASVAIGAVEVEGPLAVGAVIALADEALARAEHAAPHAVATLRSATTSPSPLGEGQWRQQLEQALAQNQVMLQEFPVCTADGRVLHLDCPVRVRWQAGGHWVPAQRWLPLAQRSRLCAELDQRAVQLALDAIAADGQARCINLAAATLVQDDAVAAITRALQARPMAAQRLWIDVPESAALEHPRRLREVSLQWRPLGVSLGLEHAGDRLAQIGGLMSLGLDCVRIDASYLRGLAEAGASDARQHLQGLVRLSQAAGLVVIGEGVSTADDLDRLWLLGLDAATGPAVRVQALEPQPV